MKSSGPLDGIDKKLVEGFMSELHKESDRGAVLITVAIIDDSLSTKLSQVLREGSMEAQARLLDPPQGALAGFMSKVDLAYCLGLYPQYVYEDVRFLNRLRNKCAHEWRSFEIDDEILRRYIRPMHAWKPAAAVLDLLMKYPAVPERDTPRMAFSVAAAILITTANLATLPEHRALEPQRSQDPISAPTSPSAATGDNDSNYPPPSPARSKKIDAS